MERTIKPENLKNALADKYLIDVRRKADFDASSETLPGATWHDPKQLVKWVDSLIILYCVRGGSVSNGVVDALQRPRVAGAFHRGWHRRMENG